MSTGSGTSRFVIAYASLMVLLVVTVGVAVLDLGRLSVVVALAVAMFKTIVIAAIFMHLDGSPAIMRTFAVVGLLTVTLLVMTTLDDTRRRRSEGAERGAGRGPDEYGQRILVPDSATPHEPPSRK